jgi:hypothetical protein
MVIVLASNGDGVASHRAAARLHGLDGFDHPGMAVIEASVTRRFRLELPNTVTHHITPLDDVDRTTVNGFPCTTVARTLGDLGAVVDRRQVHGAFVAARRKGIAVEAIRQTIERVHRPGPAGTGMMLWLLDGVPCEGRVADSWFEELLARCLDAPALPAVVPPFPIVDVNGRIVARTDLGIPLSSLASKHTVVASTSVRSKVASTRSAIWRSPRAGGSCDAQSGQGSLRHELSAYGTSAVRAPLTRCTR